MPFAGFRNFNDCVNQQLKRGKSRDSANRICGSLQAKEEKMQFKRFVPITKTDEDKKMIFGWASTNDLDNQGEVVSVEAMKKALPDYMKFPTIREMHQPKAAGVTKQTTIDSAKGLFIGAKIVDKEAWEKVKEGVYKGLSIGGRVKGKVDNMITDIALSEISLVDRPANPKAVITVFKADSNKKEDESYEEQYLKVLKGLNVTTLSKDSPVIKRIKALSEEVRQMAKKVKKTKKEETKVKPKKVEKESPKREVVVDNAKQTSAQPSDLKKDELMTRLEKIEEKLTVKKKKVKVKKIEKLDSALVKVASVLEKLAERVEKLEAQPAQPKTKASFLVEKTSTEDKVDPEKATRLEEVNKRLAELMDIRQEDMAKFQANYQKEAWRLMDEKRKLEAK